MKGKVSTSQVQAGLQCLLKTTSVLCPLASSFLHLVRLSNIPIGLTGIAFLPSDAAVIWRGPKKNGSMTPCAPSCILLLNSYLLHFSCNEVYANPFQVS